MSTVLEEQLSGASTLTLGQAGKHLSRPSVDLSGNTGLQRRHTNYHQQGSKLRIKVLNELHWLQLWKLLLEGGLVRFNSCLLLRYAIHF